MFFRGFKLLFCVETSTFWRPHGLKQTTVSVTLTQVLKTVVVWPVPSQVFSFTNLFDSLYNTGQQERMLPIYQGTFFHIE